MMPTGPIRDGMVSVAVRRHEATLCKLAIADDASLNQLLSDHGENLIASGLEPKAHALVRLGALIAVDPNSPAYMCTVESARRAGVSEDELVGCLLALLPTLGVARVVSAAPQLGLALGYDVMAALESCE
jgi:4-carboxymuconolactone decarboxylase